MEKLSVVTFSKDDISNALDLVKYLYNTADEFILLDSSQKKTRELLKKEKKRLGLGKLRIFTTVALGYPDPLRMYGLSKCSNKWVLLSDGDERLSPALKADIKRLITKSEHDAYAIKRFESSTSNKSFFTWQIRLFRKSKAVFRGLRHEQALIKGKVGKLENKDYYLGHLQQISEHIGSQSQKLEPYDERMSYELYNKRFMEYLGRLMGGNAEGKGGKLAKNLLLGYQRLGMKSSEKEVSDFDYFVFNFLKEIGYTLEGRSVKHLVVHGIPYTFTQMKKIKEWKSSEAGREALEISKIINRIGITRFLGLDREETIKELNRKYKDKYEGVQLLIQLLTEKYRRIKKVRS